MHSLSSISERLDLIKAIAQFLKVRPALSARDVEYIAGAIPTIKSLCA